MLNHLVRFAPALRLLDELGGGTLLEVGSGSRGLGAWLDHRWDVTAADLSFDDYGSADGYSVTTGRSVVADARDLPFQDASFDVVATLDMLEHIARDDRPTVLRELGRVARRRVIVGCPTGATAEEGDRDLADWFRRRGQEAPAWLTEHFNSRFPEPEDLARELAAFGQVRLRRNETVRAHGLIIRAETTIGADLAARAVEAALSPGVRRRGRPGVADAVLRAVRGFDRPPSYRTIAVMDKT